MAHTIEFRKPCGLLYIHYDGVLTDRVLLYGFQEDLEAIRRHRAGSVIVDLSDVSGFSMSSETNLVLAESGRVPRDVRLVFVAPCNVQFGMARMFQLSSDTERSDAIRVVRTLTEGYAALDVTLPNAG